LKRRKTVRAKRLTWRGGEWKSREAGLILGAIIHGSDCPNVELVAHKKGGGMLIQIKKWVDGSVLHAIEADNLKAAVEMLILKSADLSGANLSGADLYRANLPGANLSRANLPGANLYRADLPGADLSEADLSGADLSEADLYRANLYRANLSGANLSEANLYRANLSGAKGISKYLTTPLYMLLDQTGLIRAYKLVTDKNTGPTYPGTIYAQGQKYEVANACCDESEQCAPGISLATLDWVIKEWKPGFKILIAEFTTQEIAAIPISSDGKFRVHSCRIVGEKDLKELGLVKEDPSAEAEGTPCQ
jgi:uncharacterized protein YjbI with pentapeptide repeats